MQITREDLPERQVALVLEFEPEEIEPALQKTYQRLVSKVTIPGFRPGKAPRALFERHVGREELVREASQGMMADAIKEAVEKENLEGSEPSNAEIESTDPLRLRVLFDLEPLAELGDYSDIRAAAEPEEVTPEKVEAVIEQLRRSEAEWHDPAEPRPAQMGDRVTLDLETYTIDGEVSNMTGTDVTFELTTATGPVWPSEIDENIVGMQVGEEKDFAITFPQEYTDEKLRGKDATVHVSLKGLQEAELPELNDEFAVRRGGVPTVDELRERVETNMREEAATNARNKQTQAALDMLKERGHVEVPRNMIDEEVQRRYDRLAAGLQKRRIAPARYFTYEGSSEKEWREAQREPARAALAELLLLREFADREKIEVSDGEVDEAVEKLLERYDEGEQREAVRGIVDTPEQRSGLRGQLYENKLAERLTAIAEGRGDGAGETPAVRDGETEMGGAIPAEEKEPGPLETAGGAAEVLGIGEEVADADEQADAEKQAEAGE